MAETTLVLALEGDLTLEQFASAVEHFRKLLSSLSQEVAANKKIEWDIEDLQYGSAVIAVAGRAEDEESVLRVVSAFEDTAEALQNHQPIPFSKSVTHEAKALMQLVGGDVISLRLGTSRKEAVIYGTSDAQNPISIKPLEAFGSVKGRVQAISNRNKLRFTVYDAVFDRPVSCYITEDQQHILTDIWDKVVTVSGRVTRQPDSGQPVSVRGITSIDFVPMMVPGSYKKARGIFAEFADSEPAEVSIRRLRDAGS